MNPESVVQRQLDAYNDRDLDSFMACYSDEVQLFRPPQPQPLMQGQAAMAAHYATKRFNLPGLHAQLVQRMVVGNKVVDHERISGVRDEPYEAAVVFELSAGLITKVWFFDAD